MIFRELGLPGLFVIEAEPFVDERGSFARTFCVDEFAARGLETRVAQCSVSSTAQRGTLRGLHLQLAPFEETKVLRCTSGAVFAAVVDLRADSPAFGTWLGLELRAHAGPSLYVPRALALGTLTLEDATHVEYVMSAPYSADHTVGLRWDDPSLAIEWPLSPAVVSSKDRTHRDVDLDAVRARGLEALR